MERPVGVKAPYPGFIPPALATAAERVPWRTVDYPNGRDLRAEPLFERKAALKKTISGTGVQFSESFEVDPKCSSTPVRPAWKVWF
jgi:hypothetical protein